MSVKLFFGALIKFILGVLIMFILLFVPAGSLNYWNGWLLMILLFIPMFIVGIVMMINTPDLLKIRLDIKEQETDQKKVVLYSGLLFLICFILAGLNYRYNWIQLPKIVVIISSVIFILSYILYTEVLRENAFLSRTIKVQKEQKVIDSGLYRVVRHPMYLSTIILFLSMQLVLGSIISFVAFLVYPFIIAKRINNEEKVLEKDLKDYLKYKKQVKYKMIPFIW